MYRAVVVVPEARDQWSCREGVPTGIPLLFFIVAVILVIVIRLGNGRDLASCSHVPGASPASTA